MTVFDIGKNASTYATKTWAENWKETIKATLEFIERLAEDTRQSVETFRLSADVTPCGECGHIMQIDDYGRQIMVCPHQYDRIRMEVPTSEDELRRDAGAMPPLHSIEVHVVQPAKEKP